MILGSYIVFSYGLFFWTIASIHNNSIKPGMEYLAGILVLTLFMAVVWNADREKIMRTGIAIAALFMNIGLSIYYRMAETRVDKETGIYKGRLSDSYAADIVIMLLVFLLVYLVVRWTKIYKKRIINRLVMISLPIAVFGARLTGKEIYGAYLYFCGILVFSIVLLGFPFVASYLLSQEENLYRRGSVRNLPWNLMALLLYTFIIYIGCAVCNEFGLLLIVGLTMTVLFFIRCKNGFTKIFYTAVCGGGALAIGFTIPHVSERIQIWLHPVAAYGNPDLEGKAESVLYVFRHINKIGYWGQGPGTLPEFYIPTLNTDHAAVTVLYDYGLWMAVGVLLLGILFVRWMLIQPKGLGVYDQYLNLSCALVVGFTVLVNIGSALGSFIIAGIGFPWMSDGLSFNALFTGLIAVHCGLIGKGRKVEFYD